MPYIALQELTLNSHVFNPGEVIPEEKMRGYYPSTLTRLGFAKFENATTIAAPFIQAKPSLPEKAVVYSDAPIETGPAKASVERRGVWFQVFVSDKKVFHSRNENEANDFAKDFNSKL